MMANMKDRVVRLETKMAPPPVNRAQMMEDAAVTTKRLLNIAASFNEDAASMSLADRLAMAPAAHCAWAMRFAPEQADPTAIMALHGRG